MLKYSQTAASCDHHLNLVADFCAKKFCVFDGAGRMSRKQVKDCKNDD